MKGVKVFVPEIYISHIALLREYIDYSEMELKLIKLCSPEDQIYTMQDIKIIINN